MRNEPQRRPDVPGRLADDLPNVFVKHAQLKKHCAGRRRHPLVPHRPDILSARSLHTHGVRIGQLQRPAPKVRYDGELRDAHSLVTDPMFPTILLTPPLLALWGRIDDPDLPCIFGMFLVYIAFSKIKMPGDYCW